MKKSSLVALVALTASVMADDMGKSSKEMNGQPMQRADGGMMNVSSYPMIDSHKWDLFADLTLWRAEQGGTEWSAENIDDNGVGETTFKKTDFDWDWGFKVGIGYNMMKHDQWDMQLYYTWFRAEQETNAGIAVPATLTATTGVDPFFTGASDVNGSVFQSGENHWHIHYNMFDWELGRGYMVSKHLALRPHVGVKGGWIHQKVHGHFNTFNNVETTYEAKNNFWGVGPSGGINTKWELGNYETHYFSLFADFAGAWMWGHWDVHHESFDDTGVAQKSNNLSRDLGAVMLQGFMGFGWDTNFHDDRCHFAMRLGYEVQHWFNQLQFFPPGNAFRYNYDLTLQGGTLDFRFDF